MSIYDALAIAPNFGSRWHGELISVDGTAATPFTEEEVERILYAGATPDDWDGQQAAVLLLKDGRYVAYETDWGPTGDGFNEDAYGGDADVYFGKDLNRLVLTALTDSGRRLCGIPEAGLG
jgi:hypothetical protein